MKRGQSSPDENSEKPRTECPSKDHGCEEAAELREGNEEELGNKKAQCKNRIAILSTRINELCDMVEQARAGNTKFSSYKGQRERATFFYFYEQEIAKLRRKLSTSEEELKTIDEELNMISKNRSEMKRSQSSSENNAKKSKVTSIKHYLKVESDSLKKVTVFEDRADVKREFTATLAPGLNEVAIQRISNSLIDDSVRVTGKGDAIIEEVQVAERRVLEGAGDTERAAKLRPRRLMGVEWFADSHFRKVPDMKVGAGIAAPKEAKFSADKNTLESVTTFFDFYDKQATELREKLTANEEASSKIKAEIKIKNDELTPIQQGVKIKVVSILLDSSKGGDVALDLTYQVRDASWDPLYDVRVDTKEGKTGMQLSYFGNVYQRTGEDWEGAQLILSTTQPSLGGAIPDLNTLDVVIVPPQLPRWQRRRNRSRSRDRCRDSSSDDDARVMKNREASVNKQTLSTEFVIDRPCSIPSDDADHKVTIGIVTLAPRLVHVSVPSKNPCAFLTASAVNTSSLPLLKGDASIYLDGAFVTKTKIEAVSPGEQFTASLGVDPAVKIEYKPAHKYREEVGLVTRWATTITEQKIAIKNTREDAILLTIREQIPRSTDEKIKTEPGGDYGNRFAVSLIAPAAVENVQEDRLNEDQVPKEGVRLLPSNNLEWTMKMDKGKYQTLIVKYSVKQPSAEKIEFVERRR